MLEKQVSALSLELFVRLLLHDNDHIAGLHTRELVGLTVESVLAIVRCALINHGFENFLFLGHFLALAGLAFVRLVDNLALAMTVVTGTLRLGVHAWAELLHSRYNTASTARGALLYSAFFATDTVASIADAFAVHSDFG